MKPITTDSTFPSLLKTCMECKWVSIDMEFYRRTTYYPQLCLIQIASPNFVEMIDVLACDKKTLNDFLRALAEHPLLVFYSPDQDLEIWKLWTGRHRQSVFCWLLSNRIPKQLSTALEKPTCKPKPFMA